MKKMNFRLAFGLVTVLLLAIAVFGNSILGDLQGSRLDLTEDQLFTLSPSAQNILSRLKVPVQVKYYVTREDKMPTELKQLEQDITDKLRDYAAASGGMLEFSIHDPSDDEELQQSLQTKGVRPFQVRSVERDEIGLKLIWSAITIAYKDKPEEILPQVLPQSLQTLEYELVSRVFRLDQERKPVVVMFAQKPQHDPQMLQMYMQMGMQPPELPDTWQTTIKILEQEHYDVRRIDLTAESPIPAEADVLMVMDPKSLSERQVWEIGQALSRGVNTIVAVQNHLYNYNPSPQGGFQITARQQSSGLESLLGQYGLSVGSQQLFDAESEVLSIPRTQNLMGFRVQTSEPVRAPMQIAVRGEQMNRDVAITNRIETIFYLWGTSLQRNPAIQAGLNLGTRVLFSSSRRSWLKPFSPEPLTTADINPRGRMFNPELPLALLLDGQFPDPDGEIPPWPGAIGGEGEPEDAGTPFKGAPAPAELILVGCAKVFEEPFVQAGHNGLLLLNSVDAMALDGDLIGIRSKLIIERGIKSVDAGAKLLYRIFAVVLVPVLIALFGMIRLMTRRKDSARYEESIRIASQRS